MKTSSIAAALLLPLAVLAQPAALLDLSDPAGDDVGDGTLTYPTDGALTEGDLDLRGLRVFAESDGGLRFEASFRNPIRDPATALGMGPGGQDLSAFARRGFYAFNLDIYLDTDRVPGSGNTATLPGRHARIAPEHAWDKAIVLTPRPELMRGQLRDALAGAGQSGAGDISKTIDGSVFFATDVRVRGRTVSFTVPASFVAGVNMAETALTAIVTAAKQTIEAQLSFGAPSGNAIERLSLGAQQPQPGRPLAVMGYTGSRAPASAVVDLLASDPAQQAQQLAVGANLTGFTRSGRNPPASTAAVAVAPSQPAPPAPEPTAGGSWFSRALDSVARLFGTGGPPVAAPAVAAPAAPAAPPPTMQTLLQPATASPPAAAPVAARPAAPAPAAAAAPLAAAPVAAPAKARDPAFYEDLELRMRTLKRLRDSGLISEEEFQQKRRDLLEKL